MIGPYVSPTDLLGDPNDPTTGALLGVNWTTVSNAELLNVCEIATTLIESLVGYRLRAHLRYEELPAPSHRVGLGISGGAARFLTSEKPIVSCLAAQVAYGGPPFSWSTVPITNLAPETPLITDVNSSAGWGPTSGVAAILVGGGVVSYPQGSSRLGVTYIAGWPHAQMTADAPAGSTTLQVDDVTAFNGAICKVYDQTNTEFVTVIGVTPNVPNPLAPIGGGTITLSSPTMFNHPNSILVSTLPPAVRWATSLGAKMEAIERGISATTVQQQTGRALGGATNSKTALLTQIATILNHGYRRVY